MKTNLLLKGFCLLAALFICGTAFSQEARIDSTEYATLQEAIDAAQDKSTIYLLKDITSDSPLTISGKNGLVLEMDQHSITMTGEANVGIDISKSVNYVEINRGTIDASAVDGSKGINMTSSSVIINRVTITTSKPSSTCVYVSTTMDGDTPVEGGANDVQLINCTLTSPYCGICLNGQWNHLVIHEGMITANRGINICDDPVGSNRVVAYGPTINAEYDEAYGPAVGIYNGGNNTIYLSSGGLFVTDGQGLVSRGGQTIMEVLVIVVKGSKTGLAADGETVMPPSAVVFDATGDNSILTDNLNSWIKIEGGIYNAPDGTPAVTTLRKDGDSRQYIYIKEGSGIFSSDVSDLYGEPSAIYILTDNTQYKTLDDAIAAVKDGETIKLFGVIELTKPAVIDNGKTFAIDFNEYYVVNDSLNALEIKGGSNVTLVHGGISSKKNGIVVKDATVELTDMYVEGESMAVAAGGNANITINSGNYSSGEFTVLWDGTDNNITIKDGMFLAFDNAVLGGNGSKGNGGSTINIEGGLFVSEIETEGYIACGIYSPANDNIHVKGGIFDVTSGVGILARAGNITIEDSVRIYTTESNEGGWVGDSKNIIPCSAIVYDAKAQYPGLTDGAKITVNGGIFSTDNIVKAIDVITADGQTAKDYVVVNGGMFLDKSAADYLSAGRKLTEKQYEYDGTYFTYYIVEVDEATGIGAIQNSKFIMHNSGAVYNLSGQKVAESLDGHNLPKGMYIVNGKKIIIR